MVVAKNQADTDPATLAHSHIDSVVAGRLVAPQACLHCCRSLGIAVAITPASALESEAIAAGC